MLRIIIKQNRDIILESTKNIAFSHKIAILTPMLVLNAEKRDTKISPQKVRKSGKIPAVFYGRKEKSTPISVLERDFVKVWKQAGESTVVDLKGDFGELETLITEADADPITGIFRHIDFYVIEKGQKVKVKIPLEFKGVSTAIKDLGGTLVKVTHVLEVEASPKDLPKTIEVDLSSLKELTSQVLVKDLKLPQGVVAQDKPEKVIASIAVFKEEVEEVAPVDISQIGLSEKKGKEPKEGEAQAEGAVPAKDAPAKPAPVKSAK